MTGLDFEHATIAGLAPVIKAKKISVVDVTKQFIDRIERYNPALNAFQTVTADDALKRARALDRELGEGKWRGPLHGIPFSIKDNLATRGVKTTAGSKQLADWIPDYDASVVEKLKSSGAVMLGKTNMHEWASGSTTINPYYGTTTNPWDRQRISGGSSGGSAASVAADLCLGSIGTDNAGSVRHPASLCGVVGLKATFGRVSRYGGVLGTGGFSTDHVGPFAKTVEDCTVMLKAIAGHDPKDPLSSREPVPTYTSAIGKSVKGLRVGLINGYFDEFMSAEVRGVFDAAVRRLKSLGMQVVKLDIPHTDLIATVQLATSRVENVATAHEYLKNSPRDYSPPLFYRHIKSLLIPADVYVTAQRVRRLICEAFESAFDKVDVIVAPTVGSPAQTIEECRQGFAIVDGRRVELQDERGTTGTLCTIPFNVTGLPAMSLCCGFSANGLPIGMQIVGAPFDEARLFQVGHAYERAAGWYCKRPILDG